MYRSHYLFDDKELINDKTINSAIGILFFILATTLGAYVRIPIKGSPVPITLQTFFVMLAGAVLGRSLGSFSQFAYLVLGSVGLPVFQGSSYGAAYLFGPTGGYIIGFVIAAYCIGYLINLSLVRNNMKGIIASFIVGDVIIHTSGTLWLIFLHKIGPAQAVSIGILPFIPGEIFKILFAAIIYSNISRRSKDIFSS